jgi:D-amino-acid oxidase
VTPRPSRGSAGVVGAGVMGLTTAIVAQEAGYRVTVYADRATMETTSAKAAASFKPTILEREEIEGRVLGPSWERFERVTCEAPEAGVRMHVHWEASSSPLPAPWYLGVMREPTYHEGLAVPGDYPYAWRYQTFFVDTPVFLPWLVGSFEAAGGLFAPPRQFTSLDELAGLPHDVVFNCTGLGARELCADENVIPVRGQIAVVGPQPQMDWSIKHDGFYVYPRKDDTVLGGTSEEDVWDDQPESSTIEALVHANQRILPHLKVSDVVRSYAGLRPYRVHGLRIEAESVDGKLVVHNYGHGGAGITLSWGSALEAVGLSL